MGKNFDMPVNLAKFVLQFKLLMDMRRLDLVRLRKNAGLSQKELADMLSVRPSFLSAIENGRSRLPEEKLDRLKDIFQMDDFSDYMVEDKVETVPVVPPHTHIAESDDALTALLKHIHAQAHMTDDLSKSREAELEERISYLTERNDRLSDRLDDLREQVDRLREENFHLKELLALNGIQY